MAKRQPSPPLRIATQQRYNRAPDGIHEESISSYRRERVTFPMTLLPALVHEHSQLLHSARTGEKPSDPPLKKTRLDKALDHDETQSLRWSLSRYVCDYLMAQESSAGASGIPFSAARQAALGRLAYIHGRLRLVEKYNLHQFSVMMGALHPALTPMSMAQFGHERTGLPDTRIQEGAAIERVLSLAERLYELYKSMDTREYPREQLAT